MKERIVELPAIKESTEDFDAMEKRLKDHWRKTVYIPLLRQLNVPSPTQLLKNEKPDALKEALFTGRIAYSRGRFIGRFNAAISKELRRLGAQFEQKTGTFKLEQSLLPWDVRDVIAGSEVRFQEKIAGIDQKLAQILPEEIAAQFKCAQFFDRTLFKTDKDFRRSVQAVAVAPQLTPERRKRIADEWQNNMQLWIQDWTEKEIKALRARVQVSAFAGKRQESLVPPILKITEGIQASYEQAVNKAKFLARQETSLLMTKFKETRYTDSGIHEYRWGCVHQPHDKSPDKHIPGNVRYAHGILEGQIFRWSQPPVTSNPGEPIRRNNPGQDFNCRCFARPIVRFK